MHVVFLNPDPHHRYTAATPFEQPLPGSQSAQVYLALALGAAGHQATLVTGTPRESRFRGVLTRPLNQALDAIRTADLVVVTNTPAIALEARSYLDAALPVVAWQHNYWAACGADAVLLRERFTGLRDIVLCVSDWHRTDHIDHGGLDPARVGVLRNAVAPVFETLFADLPEEAPLISAKAWPPRLAFTSVPYKGLEPALDLFDLLHRRRPETSLLLFSSFDFYPDGNTVKADRRWAAVAERAAKMPGVLSLGNVPQARLARALRGTLALFYPCVLPETSSIAAMEAMAAGCLVVTSQLGALPETLAGHGLLAEGDGKGFSADDLLSKTLGVLKAFTEAPETLEGRVRAQVAYAARTLTWANRAAEFEAMAESWLRRP